jgi:hypothetical protein
MPIECNSDTHNKNILEGRKVFFIVDNNTDDKDMYNLEEVDVVCCSECDIRDCYNDNIPNGKSIIEGIYKDNIIEKTEIWLRKEKVN